MDIQQRESRPNPISQANFFSKHFLVWFWPIFKLGYSKKLTQDVLWDPADEDQARANVTKLERAWNGRNNDKSVAVSADNPEQVRFLPNNVSSEKPGNSPRNSKKEAPHDNKILRWALFDTFGIDYFLAWPLIILTDCGLKVVQPWFMLLLVRSFIEEPRDETAQYLYAAGVCISTLLITLTSNPCLFYLGRLCQRCRISLASLIQRKVLRLSAASQKTNQGQITNLITNDVSTIETNLMQVPYLVIAPLQLIIFVWFLFVEFGWSSMAGLGFIFIYMPFQYLNGTWSTEYRGKISAKTDERARLLSEVVDAIQSVKMAAWEFVFQDMLQKRRKEEVQQQRKRSRLHAFQMAVFLTSSRIVPFLTFTAFVLYGGPLTADRVFYAVAVYNTMTHYMVSMLPGAIRGIGEIAGSLSRLQKFLQLPEKPSNGSLYKKGISRSPRISLRDVSASWHLDNNEIVLSDLNCQLADNKLVAVVGKIGCGKTSLLHLILNELRITFGNVVVDGALSYAPQESNLFPGSIRANILNSDNDEEFDQERYDDVLRAACLDEDIKTFKGGDKRKVVGLSGGQKARVNLARALYHKANIYLMDDPLSAVDPGVSRNIFDKAIKDYLGNTLRILVTHQVQYLDEVDHVIVMDGSKIVAQGSHSDIKDVINQLIGQKQDASVDEMLGNGTVKIPSAAVQDTAANKVKSEEVEGEDDPDEVDKEDEKVGALGLKIYWKYFHSGNSNCQLWTYFFIFIIAQLFTTFIEYWLALWTNAEEKMYEASLTTLQDNSTSVTVNDTVVEGNSTFTWQDFEHYLSNLDSLEQHYYFYVYLVLTIIVFLTNLAKSMAFFQYCMRICTRIHEKMLRCLLRATPLFFDTNPSGRIMNRFTKDIAMIDEQIPFLFFNMGTIFLQVITVIALIIFAIWYSVVPIIVFIFMLGFVRRYYVTTSRLLKRIDGTTRSPVISHAQATYSALVTMRALGAQENLSTQFDDLQDMNTSATISFLAANQCFNIWIELLATVLLTLVAFGFLLAQNYLGMNFLGGNVGLAICSAMSLTIWLQLGMTFSANVENLMISVERALEYTKLPPEAPLDSIPSAKPDSGWPEAGEICFENASLSYDGKNNVLNNLSFDVRQREKIGIVGQTGAGKSSVLRGLFRMTELNGGRIFVDRLNIGNIGLHDLRKCLVIIPQEPKLFKGTLEFNLDPWIALPGMRSINSNQMKEIIKQIGLDKTLDFEIDNKGGNLSYGERQLVSIARALLLNKKIICLDEATAHIDPKTDMRIQDILRNKLKESTTITIAHRLGTVIESDRILVLNLGNKVEYDHPHTLLQKSEEDGWLKKMVIKTGTESANDLENRALESWRKKAE